MVFCIFLFVAIIVRILGHVPDTPKSDYSKYILSLKIIELRRMYHISTNTREKQKLSQSITELSSILFNDHEN
jgi:hypothetical protein